MKYLSIEEVYFLHEKLIQEIGGRAGIRDFNLFHSAVARPQATFGGEDLYPDLFSKGAALTQSLLLNHPFNDANKRTAFFALNAFLFKNGLTLKYTKHEGLNFCLGIENKKLKFENIVSWIKKRVKKYS